METVTLAEVNSLSSSTRKRNEVLYTTPTVQRIVNKDMKTPGASPTLRGGLNVRSPAIPPVNASVPLNDDEAEKRQRRLESRRKDFMSPGGHTPKNITSTADRRKQCSAGSQYSNAQIADHYKQCVKLSSENKINSKNAFGLHLIDYMADMLHRGGDMTNFQVAGCTLDASAKIYAGRVDSIYNDAYKMLGGLGRGSQGNEDGDDQEEADTEATDSGQQKKKKNTTRAVTVQTIERNTKSLDVVTFDLEFEVDPLYKKTSAAFDEGGIEGLLLNQIHPEDDLLSLKLDPSLGPSTVSTAPCGVAIQKMHLAAFVKEVDFVNRRICPTFGNFRFQIIEGNDDAWNLHNITDGKASLTPRSTFIEHESDNEPPEYQQDFSVAEVTENLSPEADIGPEDTTVHDAMHDGHQLLDFHMSADRVGESRNVYTLSDVLQESEYSYFKSDMLSTWAGPQFWKKKTVSQSLKQLTKSKKKEPKKVYRIDFSCSISESDFLPGKGSTQLSKSALSKMKLTTLPHDDKTEALSLLRLFHNPHWTVSCLDIQGVLVTVCLICMNVSVTAGTASQTFFKQSPIHMYIHTCITRFYVFAGKAIEW
jgi:condensin complex subunit 2